MDMDRDGAGGDGAAPSILVVEDNALMRKLFVRCLEEGGYEVAEATDARTVLERMRDLRPDLVVMDIVMPNLSGVEVIRQIRAAADLAATPVVAVTNLASDADRRRLSDAGFDAHMPKPVKPKELQSVVAGFLKAPTA
ncbi:response regulator [Azospirillum agricola]|uniref:response regulator n=1 Tax=Azospirillum agricola TaxID=1720247 RepID=UPI000A0F2120|nr:response regulator [Azospirillum agricola]SMH48409.1 two-component system, cell cycle response regulator DivK [Azospirillum lipoferum]